LQVTPWNTYQNRREFLNKMIKIGAIASIAPSQLIIAKNNRHFLSQTPIKSAQNYNNYYEFSTNKEAVMHLANSFSISPWSISIEGEVKNPLTLSLSDILDLESVERVYPLRCVEGWSMVIPWKGIELRKILNQARVKTTAKYVKFVGTYRPEEMFNQRRKILPWPYTEGLRIDEAMHPLTILATGMYDETLSKQNGAPIRLVVPWKYGFKSIKAIQKIIVQKEKPKTSWNMQIPSEYGFYANVNPSVAHPRWSQSREVRIGELRKRPTNPFNGFKNEVSHMYKNLDLELNF